MKKVKIILCTKLNEIVIAQFGKNYYEAIQCASLLQSKVNCSDYIYYVEFVDENNTLRRRQP